MVIVDAKTGDRVIWRGGVKVRAYDRRGRLISSLELAQPAAPKEPERTMQTLARSLRQRRRRFAGRPE